MGNNPVYINKPIKNLTKLFERKNIKIAYETDNNLWNIINTTNKASNTQCFLMRLNVYFVLFYIGTSDIIQSSLLTFIYIVDCI